MSVACAHQPDANRNEISLQSNSAIAQLTEDTALNVNSQPEPITGRLGLKSETENHGQPNKQILRCKKLFKNYVRPLQSFVRLATTNDFGIYERKFPILLFRPSDCLIKTKRERLIQMAYLRINENSQKIGVVMPFAGKHGHLNNELISGLRHALSTQQKDVENFLIVKNVEENLLASLRGVADLIMQNRISTLVFAGESKSSIEISKWMNRLFVPTIVVGESNPAVAKKQHIFRAYPDIHRLALALVLTAKQRGIRKVAILQPISGKSDVMVEHFEAMAKQNGIEVALTVKFANGNFQSMEAASQKLFQLDKNSRVDEYREVYLRAKEKAEHAGVPFDHRMVQLRPKVEFDAVFLPEDFMAARHFAKIFMFHGVDKMVMMGNHQWRSPGLISPKEPYLEQSFFVDFVGAYDELPENLSNDARISGFFVDTKSVATMDYRFIGYRCGTILAELRKHPDTSRRKLYKIIEDLNGERVATFQAGPIFDANHVSNWPAYIFTVKNHKLELSIPVRANEQAAGDPMLTKKLALDNMVPIFPRFTQ